MANNYNYTHTILRDMRGIVCDKSLYQDIHIKHCNYINNYLKPAVVAASCGWDDLRYELVKYPHSNHLYSYMVLYVGDKPERWIPIDGNSDGCNLQVVGENLW